MKNKRFFCRECRRLFDDLMFYGEKHGLECPPYERIVVCSKCGSTEIEAFNTLIEKSEVLEKVLPAIAAFNRLDGELKDVFGKGSSNSNLVEGLGLINELVSEMFSFIDVGIERKILKMLTEKDVDNIWIYLKG